MSNLYITSNTGLSPKFAWQVGVNSEEISVSDIFFRVTLRPLTYSEQYNRIPNPTVLYEETGIQFNQYSGFGYWEFPIQKNISLSNGPFRDYQIVIEAHDRNGETSAGNFIGDTGEVNWNVYPDGYDAIAVYNPRITGVELLNNLATYNIDGDITTSGRVLTDSITGHGYSNVGYIGPNGDIMIQFTSGEFSDSTVGGYVYVSTGQFPTLSAAINTGYWGEKVKKSIFSFNNSAKQAYSANAASNLVGRKFGYVSISFFDSIDYEYIKRGIDVSTGLYISNNAKIYNDAVIGNLFLGGGTAGSQSLSMLKYTGEAVAAGYGGIDWGNSVIIASGTVSGVTSILYMNPSEDAVIHW